MTLREAGPEPVHDQDEITTAPDGRPLAEQPAWRQDFPIDWPIDQYVARRDFAKFLGLVSLSFAGGQAWIAAQQLIRRARPAPPRARLAALSELAVGAAVAFTYPGPQDHCLLLRPDASTVVAYSQACTHLSCPVRPDFDQGRLLCPCHEGSFDLRSGKNLAGPPPRPLPRIELEVDDGIVYAVGVERRVG